MAYSNNSNNQQRNNDRVSFELLDHIGVLASKDNGWTKEVNIVAWNGGVGKVDVREWDPEHVRMSRGITLFEEEAEKLTRALAERYKIGATASDEKPEPAFARASTDEAFTDSSTESAFSRAANETQTSQAAAM